MLDLGAMKPGSTFRIPWGSFAGATGAPITMTGYAAADVKIYKDGGTTPRASAAGISVLTDFASNTGGHTVEINLSDNTTADFYAAGSEYLVFIGDVTIDSQTMRFPLARFTIGYRGSILDTTIATLTSQTVFTLANGPADANALVGCAVVIHDAASAVQIATGTISAYSATTKQVTLDRDPAVFTMAAKDNVSVFPPVNALWRPMVDISAVPAINASVQDALNWLFVVARNKLTETATTQTLYKNDGTTAIATSAMSDDGTTFTRSKFT